VAAGTISNLVAAPKRRLPWIGSMPGAAGSGVTPTPSGSAEGDEIGTAAAHTAWSEGTRFLDARPSADYAEEGHIPGARSFAVWEGDVDAKVVDLMGEFPPDTPIVTYCTGGDCTDSHILQNKLQAAGFRNVKVYQDGFPGWVEAGGEVER